MITIVTQINNIIAVIDDIDAQFAALTWSVDVTRGALRCNGYRALHREIAARKYADVCIDDYIVIFMDSDRLNCRRNNIQLALRRACVPNSRGVMTPRENPVSIQYDYRKRLFVHNNMYFLTEAAALSAKTHTA